MKHLVLVLNADYLPHRVIDWKTAFVQIYSKDENSAHVAATYKESVKDSMGRVYNIPSVIVLNEFVKSNNKICSYSKSTIHLRDGYTCQYCGGRFNKHDLTVDHVTPKAHAHKLPKGYKLNSFENCVSSCQSCNSKKADRTPKEANMQLRSIPRTITKAQKILMEIKAKHYPEEWKAYIEHL